MAVSKRTRFEILRRDSHTCQYCGQMAPDVVLHVDHIIPVALGGVNDPSNLVAACKDCNAGKSSIAPDSPIVAAIGARSAEWALAAANRAAHISSDLWAIEIFEEEFLESWNTWTYASASGEQVRLPLPADWRLSLRTWWQLGVKDDLLAHARDTAMNATQVLVADKFRYMAGVIWRTLDEYDVRYPNGSNAGRVYSESEYDEASVEGWQEGYRAAEIKLRASWQEDANGTEEFSRHLWYAGWLAAVDPGRRCLEWHVDRVQAPAPGDVVTMIDSEIRKLRLELMP